MKDTKLPKLLAFLLCTLLLLPACSSTQLSESEGGNFFKRLFSANSYKLYRISIQQGNEVHRENFLKLKPGLSKEQVDYLLGESLTPTLFHKNRWDYSYYYISGLSSTRKRLSFSIFFENDKVVDICQHLNKKMYC